MYYSYVYTYLQLSCKMHFAIWIPKQWVIRVGFMYGTCSVKPMNRRWYMYVNEWFPAKIFHRDCILHCSLFLMYMYFPSTQTFMNIFPIVVIWWAVNCNWCLMSTHLTIERPSFVTIRPKIAKNWPNSSEILAELYRCFWFAFAPQKVTIRQSWLS